jgi:branched-chain amino acid transport system substrate-binding protein
LVGTPALAKLPIGGGSKWVLGQTLPLTGTFSEVGLAYGAGSKLYFDFFNNSTSVNAAGLKVELRQLDDAHQPAQAALNMRKLLAEGVDLLFGCVGTAISEIAAEAAKQDQTVLFAPLAASDVLRNPAHAEVFHIQPAMMDEAMRMLQHCEILGYPRVCIIAQNDRLGQAATATLEQAAMALKFKAPSVHVLNLGAPISKVQLNAMLETQPQAVLQASQFATSAAVINALRIAGYRGQFFNFSFVGIGPLYSALGKDVRGIVVAQGLPTASNLSKPIVREYLAAIDKTDQTPNHEGLSGFIAAKTLCHALLQTKPGTIPGLQKQLTSMTSYNPGGINLNLRAAVGSTLRNVELVSIAADGTVLR